MTSQNQRRPANRQQAGRFRHVAVGPPQRLDDELPLPHVDLERIELVAASAEDRRYRIIMLLAEQLASHSVCAGCQAYARFRSMDENPRMKVQCRKCGHEWVLD